ncbi:hypothetical protein tinsulaeT_30950 [Thalassotalea insulae]|uniref:DUF1318 domain-containing protein n=2 Tax=Thalassotalea insulae TaxID=2056778 RepID=A0ABQ6GUZ2_9GAMM|nr:hypothetical protein tinsulaeT_30950 [Thalassotalea insulae]
MPNNITQIFQFKSLWQLNAIIMLALASLLLSQHAIATDIGALKAQKIAGEQSNGYVGLIKTDADTAAKNLVDEINAKRKNIYQKLATKQQVSLAEIEKVAGAHNISKTPSGQLVKDKSGNWVSK